MRTGQEPRIEANLPNGGANTMYACTCGRTFPGTLNGAWEAKAHAERDGHPLVDRHERARAPPASVA